MYIFTKDEKYITVDNNSGYPYETNYCLNVKVWNNIEDASRYKKLFPEETWQLHKLHGLDFSLEIKL